MLCNVSVQVIPEVIDNVLETVKFSIAYGGKPLSNGQHLRPSQAAVCAFLNRAAL